MPFHDGACPPSRASRPDSTRLASHHAEFPGDDCAGISRRPNRSSGSVTDSAERNLRTTSRSRCCRCKSVRVACRRAECPKGGPVRPGRRQRHRNLANPRSPISSSQCLSIEQRNKTLGTATSHQSLDPFIDLDAAELDAARFGLQPDIAACIPAGRACAQVVVVQRHMNGIADRLNLQGLPLAGATVGLQGEAGVE